jgi:SRSO17 transposase
MDASQIKAVGRGIEKYLAEFSDCFGRCDTESYLAVYVRGQNSNLQRKSVEPMALQAGIPPRSLQAFLSLLSWDEVRMVDRVQQIVMRDHGHPWAIGSVDETGCPKKGHHTATVQHQWCGRSGKVDNCVVSVHLAYNIGEFHCLLDSDLFLPKAWANDRARRKAAGIPEEAVSRSKPQMALAQIRRALGNGVRVAAWTFDEHYGQSYDFLDGLDAFGQTYVAEVPSSFCGWAVYPKLVYRAMSRDRHRGGRKRPLPRVAGGVPGVSQIKDLLRRSPAMRDQPWTAIHIKNAEQGPMVREVKAIRFWMQRHGLPTREHWLIAARNPEEPETIKFFVSNAPAGTPLEWLVYVGYSRWSIERCFEEDKDELGFDHFEVRGWKAIHRHLYLTQVSHLYLNKAREKLVAEEQAREKAGVFSLPGPRRRPSPVSGREPDREPNPRSSVRLAAGRRASTVGASATAGGRGTENQLHAASQCAGQGLPPKKEAWQSAPKRTGLEQNANVYR